MTLLVILWQSNGDFVGCVFAGMIWVVQKVAYNPHNHVYSLKNNFMETLTKKPMTGIEIIRKLVEVKEQAQRDAVYNYQNNPEVRAIVEKLKEKNGKGKTN